MFFYNEPGDNAAPPSNPPGDDPTTPIVGWTRTTIYDPNITTNIIFGQSVDTSGDGEFVVAGAPDHKVNNLAKQGRAYVFQKGVNNSWNSHYELVPTDRHPSGYDYFGKSVAISQDGNIVVVGAKKTFETPDGAAYVFEKTGAFEWSQIAKLKLSNGEYSDQNVGFGETAIAVSHDGNMIVVGAPYNNNSAGTVHTWFRAGTGETYSYAATDAIGEVSGQAGYSMQLSPNAQYLLVGSPTGPGTDNLAEPHSGQAISNAGRQALYYWSAEYSKWVSVAIHYTMTVGQITYEIDSHFGYGKESVANNNLGFSVAMSNNTLVAGIRGADTDALGETGKILIVSDLDSAAPTFFPETGEPVSATRYMSGYNLEHVALPEAYQNADDLFGHVVDITSDGETIFVAATGKSSSDLSTFGATYAFQKNATTGEWNNIGAFLSDNPVANAQFGNAMAASRDGNVVAVAEKLNSVQTSNAGAVHIFLKNS